MTIQNWFENFKRNFCNYQEYESRINALQEVSNNLLKDIGDYKAEIQGWKEELKKVENERDIYYKKSEEAIEELNRLGLPIDADSKKRAVIIEDSAELPSPLPRLSKKEDLLDEMDLLLEKYYGREVMMVGVTDTNSMEPLIDFGHTVVILPLSEEEKQNLQVGDIILFHRVSDGSPNVLHRIIQKNDGWVITRGDNLVDNDGFTAYKNIKGYLAMVIY